MHGELEHVFRVPLYDCRACGRPWPCLAAQAELTAQYTDMPLSLALYLASCWVDLLTAFARLDTGQTPDARATWERVVGWSVPVLRGTATKGKPGS
ncbi:hypothetical protein AB0J90_28535 [Micromonospora sp. NPDC049523]|uniref:hypothetical protein n=1 Tax=Micromonospora sp. NPDC049523 TaxID=3155921 RepID=UPI003449B034